MNNPALSFIIPVYNAVFFLDDCLNSILAQKNISYEIICVDDGSSDNSAKKIQIYQGQYDNIRLIEQKNAGPGVARNTGFTYATGEYIWFFDSDDWILQDTASKLYDMAVHFNADILGFEYIPANKRTIDNIKTEKITCNKRHPADAIIFAPPAPWARIYKRHFLEKASFQYPKSYCAEDLAETSRLFAECNAVYQTNLPVYVYYDNPTSIYKSNFTSSKKLDDFLMILNLLKEYSNKYNDYKFAFEYLLVYHANAFMDTLKKIQVNLPYIALIQEIKSKVDESNNLYFKIEKIGRQKGISKQNKIEFIFNIKKIAKKIIKKILNK